MSTMTFWTGDWIDFPHVTVFTYVNSLKPIFTPGLNTNIFSGSLLYFYPMQQFESNFPPGWTTRVKVSVSRWRSKTRRWKRFSKNRKFMSRWCQWWHAIKVSVKRSLTLQRVFKKSLRNVRQDWSQTKLVKNTYLSWKTMCYSSEMGKKSTIDFKWRLDGRCASNLHGTSSWKEYFCKISCICSLKRAAVWKQSWFPISREDLHLFTHTMGINHQ